MGVATANTRREREGWVDGDFGVKKLALCNLPPRQDARDRCCTTSALAHKSVGQVRSGSHDATYRPWLWPWDTIRSERQSWKCSWCMHQLAKESLHLPMAHKLSSERSAPSPASRRVCRCHCKSVSSISCEDCQYTCLDALYFFRDGHGISILPRCCSRSSLWNLSA